MSFGPALSAYKMSLAVYKQNERAIILLHGGSLMPCGVELPRCWEPVALGKPASLQ